MINIETKWRYALVIFDKVGLTGGVQKYPNTEQLETGYEERKRFASEKGIPEPTPVEFLDDGDIYGNYRVLGDMMERYKILRN